MLMANQSERFLQARAKLNSDRDRLWCLGHEITVGQPEHRLTAGFLAEMNTILAEYGFSILILRMNASVTAMISDTKFDKSEPDVFGTDIASFPYELRNQIFNAIIDYFNSSERLH